jgi:hypothetical protein
VWWQACWVSGFVGLPVPAGAPVPACDAAVVALDGALPPVTAGEVIGLGLGPMGLPVPGRATPAEVTLDYDREVHGHGDRYTPPSELGPATPALDGPAGPRTAGELGRLAARAVLRWDLAAGDRTLLEEAYDDERALVAGLLGPLASGSAAVLCRHLAVLDDDALARRVEAEGVTGVTTQARELRGSQIRHLD